MKIAQWLDAHPMVSRARYPGLTSHPRHELACRQMKDFGTMITLDLKGGMDQAGVFVEALELFAITASLGSVESLVMPPHFTQPRDFSAEQLKTCGITPSTVRLSIGAEDTDDLIADLEQALAKV
jgi:cystathionine beta-lyase/cystathionine gamma-synthase